MPAQGDGRFPDTQWTLVARLRDSDEKIARRAMDELCAQYHYPLYCYIRWRGLNHHDAQDALHDFLAKLLRLDSLQQADAGKGRLRFFLATALQRFLVNRHRDHRHLANNVSLDADMEERFEREQFADNLTPEKVLERSWASAILRNSLKDLAAAEKTAGREEQFKALEPFLSPEGGEASYSTVAKKLGQNEVAARQIVKRLREKFRTHLRKRVGETLDQPTASQIDDEIRALRDAVTA